MKLFANKTPHDPLDDLLAAAVFGELTPEERAQLELRLQTDAAARAAYQETLHMHDLLEKSYRNAQPDPAFEERMVSGVRRKLRYEKEHRETAWESAVVLWRGVKGLLFGRRWWEYSMAGAVLLVLAVVTFVESGSVMNSAVRNPQMIAEMQQRLAEDQAKVEIPVPASSQAQADVADNSGATNSAPMPELAAPVAPAAPAVALNSPTFSAPMPAAIADSDQSQLDAEGKMMKAPGHLEESATSVSSTEKTYWSRSADNSQEAAADGTPSVTTQNGLQPSDDQVRQMQHSINARVQTPATAQTSSNNQMTAWDENWKSESAAGKPAAAPTRKLVRNASLNLEVKNFQATVDALTAMVNAGGGYVDSSNSQLGGNGKRQGTVVVKVLPEKLDAFLLKLRDLGEIKNQSVSTEDVTKAYVDTQARLDNSRRMEAQLQALLARDNGKVSELLQVERELERVRGEIEQMQGELKLYDFQVEYATVTIAVQEKDLDQAAAYLLKERDEFSLFAPNVETAFQQARQAADDFKAHVLNATLNRNSGSDISAMLVATVPPDQIDGFLARVKTLGRIDNFTRETERVANDGGESDQPADETKTVQDRVLVHLSIRSDDQTPQEQTQLSVIATGDINAKAQEVKQDAAQAGASVTASSFERETDGTETAKLSFRVPLGKEDAFVETLKALGKVESLTIQRNDQPGAVPADEDAPTQIDLTLHNETAREQTQLSIVASDDIDAKAQEAKEDAAKAGAAVTASSFTRDPDGTETADLSFRLPLGKVGAFTDTLKSLGKIESLTIHRDDQPGAVPADEDAPADISLHLHNEAAIVADDSGVWPTLRRTFGEGITAFLGSVQTIGVVVAFVLPWLAALAVVAWIGRRVYVMRRK
jgi:anti-sigma factor RsiW